MLGGAAKSTAGYGGNVRSVETLEKQIVYADALSARLGKVAEGLLIEVSELEGVADRFYGPQAANPVDVSDPPGLPATGEQRIRVQVDAIERLVMRLSSVRASLRNLA